MILSWMRNEKPISPSDPRKEFPIFAWPSWGRETPFWFEGGQMPITRRLPKRGFFSLHRVSYQIVNVGVLSVFEAGSTVDAEALIARGMIRRNGGGVKILAQGDAPKNLTVKVQRVSGSARKKIEEAGGSVELIK